MKTHQARIDALLSKFQVEQLLGNYIKGKDDNDPCLLSGIFANNAKVTFDINTPNINFPAEISGNESISKKLFEDFHQQFDQIKSYYLCDDVPQLNEYKISGQKWMVSMREKESGFFRIGTGYYNWLFEVTDTADWKIKHLHVSIQQMISLTEESADWLPSLQSSLTYPWLDIDKALTAIDHNSRLITICNFLKTPHDN